jgi:hypothetical protein
LISAARSLSGYGAALVAVVVTLGLKNLVPVLGDSHPFVLLALPIVFSGWYGGLGPGVLATAACVIGADLFFISESFGTNGYPLGLIALAIEGLTAAWITAGLRATGQRASEAAASAEEARRAAAVALQMREELMSLWVARLRGPMGDFTTMIDAARLAQRSGDERRTAIALEQLQSSAALMRRTVEHWDEREMASGLN